MFFSFPNNSKRVYHRAGRGIFSTASAYRPKGIKSVWPYFYFELPLKGDRTQQIQAIAWKKKKKGSPYYFTVLAQAPVSQVPAHNKFYCNVINSWKEELGIKVLTQAARAAALRSVASVLTSAHIQDKTPKCPKQYVFSWPKSLFRIFGSISQKHPNKLLAQFNNTSELFHFKLSPSCISEESISGSFSLISSKYYWVILLGSISDFSMSDCKPRCYKLINLLKMQLSKDINFIGCVKNHGDVPK